MDRLSLYLVLLWLIFLLNGIFISNGFMLIHQRQQRRAESHMSMVNAPLGIIPLSYTPVYSPPPTYRLVFVIKNSHMFF
jgi:ABC-type multidrug transport system permease subunit